MQIPRSLSRHLVVVAAPLIGLGIGCEQSTEIPLAKVPPPPPGFGKPEPQKGAPRGASPVDVAKYRR